jgi:hypothetical protein
VLGPPAAPPLDEIDAPGEVNPVPLLRSLLLERGWAEEQAYGDVAMLCFNFPASVLDLGDVDLEIEVVDPASVTVANWATENGVRADFRMRIELAGSDTANGACERHQAPPGWTLPMNQAGLTQLAAELGQIEQHTISWPEVLACAEDGPGGCDWSCGFGWDMD